MELKTSGKSVALVRPRELELAVSNGHVKEVHAGDIIRPIAEVAKSYATTRPSDEVGIECVGVPTERGTSIACRAYARPFFRYPG